MRRRLALLLVRVRDVGRTSVWCVVGGHPLLCQIEKEMGLALPMQCHARLRVVRGPNYLGMVTIEGDPPLPVKLYLRIRATQINKVELSQLCVEPILAGLACGAGKVQLYLRLQQEQGGRGSV
jgi:hypothetical protein